MKLTSSAFGAEASIPDKYTCKGPDLSPAMSWSDAPANTATFALIMDDPDAPAGDWVHWAIWNIPGTVHQLGENIAKAEHLDNGASQGKNDFKKVGYNGPCPPPGKPHRYFLRLYALDTKLDLPLGTFRAKLDSAMQGHILAQAEYMGTFRR